ncbi:MAG: hypothetical protein ACLGIN_00965 [Candidatus Sericytochromatia bacterium]
MAARMLALWKQLTPPQRLVLCAAIVGALWFMGPFALILVPVIWAQLKKRSKQPGANDLLKTLFNGTGTPAAPSVDAPPRARTAKLRQPAAPAAAPRKPVPPPVVAEERAVVVPPAADPFKAFTAPLEPMSSYSSGPNGFDEALAMLRGEDEPKAGDRR